LTFVIKSTESTDDLLTKIRDNASKTYSIKTIIDNYMECIEEVINIPTLKKRFKEAVKQGYLDNILDEIVIQSKVEFNQGDDDDDTDE
jgi:methyltransferase-like protein